MIIVQTTGGLGNQLFQYAIGKRLSLLHNTNLGLDSSHYIRFTKREFSLKNFKTQFIEVNNYKKLALTHPLSVLKLKLGYFSKVEEMQRYHVDLDEFSKDSFLTGYWQNETYFKGIRSVLINEIELKEKGRNKTFDDLKKIITNSNSISIHIRRGDFLQTENRDVFDELKPDYYIRAIELIQLKIANPAFFVFSDDIEWTKKNTPFLKSPTFIEGRIGLRDFEELILMSLCKHNIIANSTFSWWAAWLNKNPNRIAVQPQTSYRDSSMQKAYESNQLLFSEDFIRI